MTALRLAQLAGGGPELFATIQGEGASVGVPATFLRLSGCNLRCDWCDTAYTWDWDHYDQGREAGDWDVDDVVERLMALAPRRLVITGGEPLLQRRGLVALVGRLKPAGWAIEVETNATIDPGDLLNAIDQWNCSPKLANAGNGGLRPQRLALLRRLGRHPTAWLKLVIADPPDLDEAEALVAASSWPLERVLAMPEGRTSETLRARASWLVPACIERGWRYSPRLHVLLWGDQRGV